MRSNLFMESSFKIASLDTICVSKFEKSSFIEFRYLLLSVKDVFLTARMNKIK